VVDYYDGGGGGGAARVSERGGFVWGRCGGRFASGEEISDY